MFLILVAAILLFFISTLSVVSQHYIFEKLEPAFVGALVAASGTIFAGCIAYSAATENIQIANQQRLDAVRDRDALAAKVKKDADDAKANEARAIQTLKQTVDRLIHQFDGAADSGDKDYFQRMFDAEQNGLMHPRVGRMLPEDLLTRAIDNFDHLGGLRNAVMRSVYDRMNAPVGDPQMEQIFNSNRAEANAELKKSIGELKQFLDDINLRGNP